MTTDRVLSIAWPETAKHFSRGNAGRGDAVERATRMVEFTCDRVDVRSDKNSVIHSDSPFPEVWKQNDVLPNEQGLGVIQRGHED